MKKSGKDKYFPCIHAVRLFEVNMNEAQKFLIEQGYNDLVISQQNITDPKKWVYVSDVMMEFQRNLTSRRSRAADGCVYCGKPVWNKEAEVCWFHQENPPAADQSVKDLYE